MFTHVDLKYKPRQVPQTSDPYLSLMSKEEVTKARNFHRTFPQYQETPLRSLKQMASYLGLGTVAVKDESFRYGLNSFKALGGAYAMGRFLADEVGRDISELSYSVLTDERRRLDSPNAPPALRDPDAEGNRKVPLRQHPRTWGRGYN